MKGRKESPPSWAIRFLEWYCKPELLEEIQGDIYELFDKRTQKIGSKAARRHFVWDVLRSFRLSTIRGLKIDFTTLLIQMAMFQNYLKVAWRNLVKQKLYSFINITGLAVGMTCFILIFIFIKYELSFDKFYSDHQRIYRVIQKWDHSDFIGKELLAATPAALAATLTDNFPEVELATTLVGSRELLKKDETTYFETGILVDTNFFDVFSANWIRGHKSTAFDNLENIVLTVSLAEKIFQGEDPIGQPFELSDGRSKIVSGIVEDAPQNSSLQYTWIANIANFADYKRDQNFAERWFSSSFHTFFLLGHHANPESLQSKLQSYLEETRKTVNPFPFKVDYLVQPLAEVYFENRASEDFAVKGSKTQLSMFLLIGGIVLLIASINYMNLAITRSIRRAKEVQFRKVIGANKRQLIQQFIGESIFITFIALIFAIGLTYWLLPIVAGFLDRPLSLPLPGLIRLLPFFGLLVLLVGMVSGSYPALVISRLRPAANVSTQTTGWMRGMKLQSVLITGQYVASAVLIAGSLVIYHQFQLINKKNLGYNKEQIVAIPISDGSLYNRINTLKERLVENPNVLFCTASSSLPTHVDALEPTGFSPLDDDSEPRETDMYRIRIDEGFLEVFDIPLIAGQNFSSEDGTASEANRILNQTAVAALGLTPETAVGQKLVHNDQTTTIIGVVKDFHIHSIHLPIEPLILTMDRQFEGYLSVKITTANTKETLKNIEAVFGQFSSHPFQYGFLDQEYDQLYKSDVQLGQMFLFFAVLSIVIASIGLFGLAAFSVQQRTKEVGIRKVLGAGERNIVQLLTSHFIRTILIGFGLAIPITWLVMNSWLQGFAYRVNIDWWIFALTGLLITGSALLMIGFQSLKVAGINPANALRSQ